MHVSPDWRTRGSLPCAARRASNVTHFYWCCSTTCVIFSAMSANTLRSMKKHKFILLFVTLVVVCWFAFPATRVSAQFGGTRGNQREYITIRWDGVKNTHIIFPAGKVEFIGKTWSETNRPPHVNARAFFLTLAMNEMAEKGYEFVGTTGNDIIMKRNERERGM